MNPCVPVRGIPLNPPRGTGHLFVTGKDPAMTGKHAQMTGFSRHLTGKILAQSLWAAPDIPLSPAPETPLSPPPETPLSPAPGTPLSPPPGTPLSPAPGSLLGPAPGSPLSPAPGLLCAPAPPNGPVAVPLGLPTAGATPDAAAAARMCLRAPPSHYYTYYRTI